MKNVRKEFSKRTGDGCCSKSGADTVKVAVRNLSMSVEQGEIFGLLGHNGAGKTTTLSLITAESGLTNGRVSTFLILL